MTLLVEFSSPLARTCDVGRIVTAVLTASFIKREYLALAKDQKIVYILITIEQISKKTLRKKRNYQRDIQNILDFCKKKKKKKKKLGK